MEKTTENIEKTLNADNREKKNAVDRDYDLNGVHRGNDVNAVNRGEPRWAAVVQAQHPTIPVQQYGTKCFKGALGA